MKTWKVTLTVEKEIEAKDRKTAKAILVGQMKNPPEGMLGQILEPFQFFKTKGDERPVLLDVSASIVPEGEVG